MDYKSLLAQKTLKISNLKSQLQNLEDCFQEKQEELDRSKQLLQSLQSQNSRIQVNLIIINKDTYKNNV